MHRSPPNRSESCLDACVSCAPLTDNRPSRRPSRGAKIDEQIEKEEEEELRRKGKI